MPAQRRARSETKGAAMDVKGTKTEQNLLMAFAGESQARNRYTYFAGAGAQGGVRADRGCLRGDREPGEGARQALLQFLEGRRSGNHRHLPGRRDRRHGREPQGRRGRREPRVGRDVSRLRQGRARGRLRSHRQGLRERLPSPRSSTSAATSASSPTSRTAPSSRRIIRSCGAAATAAISSKARRRRPPAPPARIRRRTIEVLAENW